MPFAVLRFSLHPQSVPHDLLGCRRVRDLGVARFGVMLNLHSARLSSALYVLGLRCSRSLDISRAPPLVPTVISPSPFHIPAASLAVSLPSAASLPPPGPQKTAAFISKEAEQKKAVAVDADAGLASAVRRKRPRSGGPAGAHPAPIAPP